MDYLERQFKDNAGSLGIEFVGFNESLTPRYPAVVLEPGVTERQVYGSFKFQIIPHLTIWVFHARLDTTKRKRTREDLQLVNDIVDFLHNDLELGGNMVFCYVENEEPNVGPGFRKGDIVIGTALYWRGLSQPVNWK